MSSTVFARESPKVTPSGSIDVFSEDILGQIGSLSGLKGIIRLFCCGSSVLCKKLSSPQCRLELRCSSSLARQMPDFMANMKGVAGIVLHKRIKQLPDCTHYLTHFNPPKSLESIKFTGLAFADVISTLSEQGYSNLTSLSLTDIGHQEDSLTTLLSFMSGSGSFSNLRKLFLRSKHKQRLIFTDLESAPFPVHLEVLSLRKFKGQFPMHIIGKHLKELQTLDIRDFDSIAFDEDCLPFPDTITSLSIRGALEPLETDDGRAWDRKPEEMVKLFLFSFPSLLHLQVNNKMLEAIQTLTAAYLMPQSSSRIVNQASKNDGDFPSFWEKLITLSVLIHETDQWPFTGFSNPLPSLLSLTINSCSESRRRLPLLSYERFNNVFPNLLTLSMPNSKVKLQETNNSWLPRKLSHLSVDTLSIPPIEKSKPITDRDCFCSSTSHRGDCELYEEIIPYDSSSPSPSRRRTDPKWVLPPSLTHLKVGNLAMKPEPESENLLQYMLSRLPETVIAYDTADNGDVVSYVKIPDRILLLEPGAYPVRMAVDGEGRGDRRSPEVAAAATTAATTAATGVGAGRRRERKGASASNTEGYGERAGKRPKEEEEAGRRKRGRKDEDEDDEDGEEEANKIGLLEGTKYASFDDAKTSNNVPLLEYFLNHWHEKIDSIWDVKFCLRSAVETGSIKMLRWLINHKCSPPFLSSPMDLSFLIHNAMRQPHGIKVLEFLIKEGKIKPSSFHDPSVLEQAVQAANLGLLRWLNNRISVTSWNEVNGLLLRAIKLSPIQSDPIVEFLLSKGVNTIDITEAALHCIRERNLLHFLRIARFGKTHPIFGIVSPMYGVADHFSSSIHAPFLMTMIKWMRDPSNHFNLSHETEWISLIFADLLGNLDNRYILRQTLPPSASPPTEVSEFGLMKTIMKVYAKFGEQWKIFRAEPLGGLKNTDLALLLAIGRDFVKEFGLDIIAAVHQSSKRDLLDIALIFDSLELLKILVSVPNHAFFGLLHERSVMRRREKTTLPSDPQPSEVSPSPPSTSLPHLGSSESVESAPLLSFNDLLTDLVSDAIQYCCSPQVFDFIFGLNIEADQIPRGCNHKHLHLDRLDEGYQPVKIPLFTYDYPQSTVTTGETPKRTTTIAAASTLSPSQTFGTTPASTPSPSSAKQFGSGKTFGNGSFASDRSPVQGNTTATSSASSPSSTAKTFGSGKTFGNGSFASGRSPVQATETASTSEMSPTTTLASSSKTFGSGKTFGGSISAIPFPCTTSSFKATPSHSQHAKHSSSVVQRVISPSKPSVSSGDEPAPSASVAPSGAVENTKPSICSPNSLNQAV
jgi:hypothetical protein